jgi:FAD/FMN-containing dehydrogenase
VLLAGDAGWDDAVLVWNGMVAKTPALVVQPHSAHDVAASVQFARSHRLVLSSLHPFSTGATYINFQTADEDEERIRAAYGADFLRLVEIKKAYDPDNLFRVKRNIRPYDRARVSG